MAHYLSKHCIGKRFQTLMIKLYHWKNIQAIKRYQQKPTQKEVVVHAFSQE
jgi:hypothetical protein